MRPRSEVPGELEMLTISHLATQAATPITTLWRMAADTESSYRFGEQRFLDGKAREIAAPNARLKRIQRVIEGEIRARTSVPASVCSVRGRGVLWGASRHLGRTFISIRDLRSAFPSTTCDRVQGVLLDRDMLEDAATLVRRLVTVRGSLPQGAPTSNAMLDLVLADLDDVLRDIADVHRAVYTRFADDLTFSSHEPVDAMMELVDAAVEAAGYRVNTAKKTNYREGDLKIVTGVVIGTSLSLPPFFVSETEYLISQAASGNWTQSRLQLTGRVDWIYRFDRALGIALRRQIREIPNRGGRFRARTRSTLRFRR